MPPLTTFHLGRNCRPEPGICYDTRRHGTVLTVTYSMGITTRAAQKVTATAEKLPFTFETTFQTVVFGDDFKAILTTCFQHLQR